jgi:hypothetical protein
MFVVLLLLSPTDSAHSAQDILIQVNVHISVSFDFQNQKIYGLSLNDYTIDLIINSLESL